MKAPQIHRTMFADEDDLREDENMTPASRIIKTGQDGYIGMTPASQQSTAIPSYAATPTGTPANEEGIAPAIYPPTGTTLDPTATRADATPTGTASNEEEVDSPNAVPRPGMPAGSGTGTQLFNLAAEDDSA